MGRKRLVKSLLSAWQDADTTLEDIAEKYTELAQQLRDKTGALECANNSCERRGQRIRELTAASPEHARGVMTLYLATREEVDWSTTLGVFSSKRLAWQAVRRDKVLYYEGWYRSRFRHHHLYHEHGLTGRGETPPELTHRIEAIEVDQLTHIARLDWLDWAKSGESG